MPNINDKSLSGLWRLNTSKDAGVELSSILDSCRILAQSLIPGVEVTFAGVNTAKTDRKKIILGTRELGSTYPVPGDTVDVVMGTAVHEIGHVLFSPDKQQYVAELLKKGKFFSGTGEDMRTFKRMVNVIEDVYVNHLMSIYPGYSDYLAKERDYTLGNYNSESITKPLENKCTQTDMLNAIIYCVLSGGKLPQNITQDNMTTLASIIEKCNKMVAKQITKDSAILNIWKTISHLPSNLSDDDRGFGQPVPQQPTQSDEPEQPEPDAIPTTQKARQDAEEEKQEQEKGNNSEGDEKPDDNEKEIDADEDDSNGNKDGDTDDSDTDAEPDDASGDKSEQLVHDQDDTPETEVEPEPDEQPEIDKELNLAKDVDSLVDDNTELDPGIAEDVKQAIIGNRTDLSQLVSNLAGDSSNRQTVIVYTPTEDAAETAKVRSKTSDAEEKLRRIIQEYRLKRTSDFRGLMSGRISSRRLSRVAYGDQRVFQRRERPDEIDMAICLLMDMSGSVGCHKDLIEQITCAITDAFQKEKVEFIALGYTGNSKEINIARLYDHETGKVNLGVGSWGDTPSYEGLAAAVAQLLRLSPTKRKILIHFTDGSPDSDKGIVKLLEDSRGRGITDIHIALGRGNMYKFNLLYGNDVLQINDINELPGLIEKQLREKLNN